MTDNATNDVINVKRNIGAWRRSSNDIVSMTYCSPKAYRKNSHMGNIFKAFR